MRIRRLFMGTTHSALWYLTLVGILPVASLAVLGLYFLWQQALLPWIVLSWLVITGIGYGLFVALPASRLKRELENGSTQPLPDDSAPDEGLPGHLSARGDWTDQDQSIWQISCGEIESLLASAPAWPDLLNEGLNLLSRVSAHYAAPSGPIDHEKTDGRRFEYRFTVPEALLVLSVASNRYREVVLSHVPYSERVNVSSLLQLYDRQRSIKSGYTWLNTVRRTLRLANPVAAAMGELKDQFTNRVFNQLSLNVQTDLKRLLLQEVVQVGIDLYSGKLKSSPAELHDFRSRAYRQDTSQEPMAMEPIRVLLLGQSSAGKSSLVNALADKLDAEIDTLPSTDQTRSYELQIDQAAPMHLIDTVGLGSSMQSLNALTDLATQADIICLVARANQPARAPDNELYQSLQARFAQMPERRRPPLLLILTHIDQLTPRAQWSPPYNLLNSDDKKSKNISGALLSCLQQIGLPEDTPAIPVCLSNDRGLYNVEAIAAQLMLSQDSATLTQLNRRRVERGLQTINWRERWGQVKRLGLVLGKASIKGHGSGAENSADDR